MEHEQEECKFDNGKWHNEQPTVSSEPFIPHTAWTPEWVPARGTQSDADFEMDDDPE